MKCFIKMVLATFVGSALMFAGAIALAHKFCPAMKNCHTKCENCTCVNCKCSGKCDCK